MKPPALPLPSISPSKLDDEPKVEKRGRRSKAEMGLQAKPEDLRPFFGTLSMVLEAVHAKPFSEAEIETGIAAWFPVWEKYWPMFSNKAIFLPAMVWTVSVFVPRGKDMLSGKKTVTGKTNEEKTE